MKINSAPINKQIDNLKARTVTLTTLTIDENRTLNFIRKVDQCFPLNLKKKN